MAKLNLNTVINNILEDIEDKKMTQSLGLIYKSQDWRECERIRIQYERAISRTSTYKCWSLADHIYYGHGLVYKHQTSYLVGNWYEGVFVLSHFAPASIKAGKEMMEFISYKETIPMVLAVPHYQAKMALRCGWDLVGLTWQEFGGTLVQKVVLCNRALPNDKYWELRERLKLEAGLRKPQLP